MGITVSFTLLTPAFSNCCSGQHKHNISFYVWKTFMTSWADQLELMQIGRYFYTVKKQLFFKIQCRIKE